MGKFKAVFKFIYFLFANDVDSKVIDVGNKVVELVKKAKKGDLDTEDVGAIAGGVVGVVQDIKSIK